MGVDGSALTWRFIACARRLSAFHGTIACPPTHHPTIQQRGRQSQLQPHSNQTRDINCVHNGPPYLPS